MRKASDLQRGHIVSLDQSPFLVESVRVSTPSARGAASLYHFRLRHVLSQQKRDLTCKGDEPFEDIDMEKRPVQFLYAEQDCLTFMDLDTFDQFQLLQANIADQCAYLDESTEGLYALVADGKVLGIELPSVVELTIAECDPPMRGATATSRAKPARLSTGLVVQVPEYLETGTRIRVDTQTGKYLSRA